jgi:hypothetical protein
MKYTTNERGALPIIVALLVLVLIAIVGVALYNANNSKGTSKQATTSTTSPSASAVATASPAPSATPAPTDQSLIAAAVKAYIQNHGPAPAAGTKLTLTNLSGENALVTIGGTGAGSFELLKKSQGTWSVRFDGQNISPAMETSLGFPQGFSNSGSSATSTVLFTY